MNATLEALLEAHVQYELQSVGGEAFARLVEQEVARAFEWLASAKLNDVSSPGHILDVIDRYVSQLRISGAIAELAGEMSHKVISSPKNEQTRLGQIIPSDSYDGIAAKVVALDKARSEILHLVARSTAYRSVVSRALHQGLMELAFGRGEPKGVKSLSLLADVGRSLARRLLPAFERHVGARLARYLEENGERLIRNSEQNLCDVLDDRRIRQTADEIWEAIAPMRLSEVFAYIGHNDLEDFIVIGYEFWLKFRKGDYFREIARELVGHFFDKYGQQSILFVIEDMGVSKEMVIRETALLVGPIMKHAVATGFLERRIRANLQAFYASDTVAAILAR